VSPAKTVEAIEMPFELRTQVGPRNHLLDIADRFHPNTVLWAFHIILLTQPSSYVRESEGICFHRRRFVSVCLFVTTITKKIVDGFVPHFMGRFLGGKGRPSSCFVTIGGGLEGVEVTVKKLRLQNSSVGKFGTSGPHNSRCGKCCQVLATKTLSRGFVLSQSTFHLVNYGFGALQLLRYGHRGYCLRLFVKLPALI